MKIKIGILLDHFEIPSWEFAILNELTESSYAEIVLIVKNNSNQVKNNHENSFNKYFYTKYKRRDDMLHQGYPDAFLKKDIHALLNVDTLKIIPSHRNSRNYISNKDIDLIASYHPDVLFQMGFSNLTGKILHVAKYGVWSYYHADNTVNRGQFFGFWEVIEEWAEIGMMLQIVTENPDAGTILHKSHSLTNKTSVRANMNGVLWQSVSFLPLKIKELYDIGNEAFFKKVKILNQDPQFYSNRLYTEPTNKEMLSYLWYKIKGMVKNRIRNRLYFNQWILLFKLSNSNTFSTSFYEFTKMIPPKDRFWADPFVIRKNNKYYIFIEEYPFDIKKGFISVIEMNDKGNYKSPVKVLERDYHLSYPFLIEDNNELYMIPETMENKSIELYKCVEFPFKWKLEIVLKESINAVDSTIFFHNNKYWLFANIKNNEGSSDLVDLYLFSSNSLINNDWKSHPKNPIVSDVKKSRPAGKLFVYNGNIYRPSQNCSKHYGYGMKINKIEKLNEKEYHEIVVDSIYPNWEKNLLSTHTLNFQDNLTVIDALLKRRK